MLLKDTLKEVKQIFNGTKNPIKALSPILLYCVALNRGGMSAIETLANISARAGAAGFPTGKNPDGSDNMILAYTYIMCDEMFKMWKNNGVVTTAIPAGALRIRGFASGPAGAQPVEATNVESTNVYGIGQ